MKRRILLASALTVFLAGCGSTQAPTGPADEQPSADAISVTDSRGTTITLDQPAERVVTLEWNNTEDVLALGVTPVAAADPAGFASWVSSQVLPESVADVGLRTEPSLESIARAEPDLILGIAGSIPEQAIAQAEEIAPVVLLPAGDASRPIQVMRQNFLDTALLLGRTAEAEEILSELDEHMEQARQALADVEDPYTFAYINVTGATAELRMHTDGSVPGAMARELGLTNAYTGAGDEVWGIGSMDLEALTTLPPSTTMLYWANESTSDPIGQLSGNALWEGLQFVQDGKVKPAAEGVWVYGGPTSMMQWVDELVTNLS